MSDVPISWTWTPKERFEIALQIGPQVIVVEVEASDRVEVAMSLSRLAEAVHPRDDVRLLWKHPDETS